jgi:alpha-ketoglutarate-dependent taurine dioxygenase
MRAVVCSLLLLPLLLSLLFSIEAFVNRRPHVGHIQSYPSHTIDLSPRDIRLHGRSDDDKEKSMRMSFLPDKGRNLLTKDPEILRQKECQGLSEPLAPSRDHVIETSLVPFNPGAGGSISDQAVYTFPLVITPKKYTSNFCLRAFLANNKEWVDEQILNYGAVLFRGFDVTSAAEVEAGIRALEPNLNNDYRGTSPRVTQEGSDYVFSAAEVPSHFPIAQHLEMSFLPSPPKRLFFSALQAPKGKVGGATALTNFRTVYRDMPKFILAKLAKRQQLKYTRTHHRRGANPLFTNDITAMKSWSEVFGTTNQTKVEEICRAEGTPMRWTGRKKDVFVSEYLSDAIQLHPQTKEPVWFNHAQVFHWTTFPAELWFAFTRSRDVRFAIRSILNWVVSFVTYVVLRKKMALNVTYGNGQAISVWDMHHIRRAIHKNMVFNQWKQGDLLMIDNFSTSHGREPTYSKGRKIVVAWSDPIEKTNEYSSSVYGLLDAELI